MEKNYIPTHRFEEIMTELTGSPMPNKVGRKPKMLLMPCKEELIELCKFGGGFSINGHYIIAPYLWWRKFRRQLNKEQ